MVMTRYVGDQYGVMMWGWGFVSTFAAVTDLGLGSANIKYVSEGYDKSACFSTFLILKMVLIGTMAALVISSLIISSKTNGLDPEMVSIIVVFLLYFILMGVQAVIMHTFTGRLENGKVSILTLSEYSVRTAVLIGLAVAGASAYTLSLAYVIGCVISLSIAIVLLKKINLRLVRPTMARMYIKFAAPLAISICLIAFVNSFDKVMVGKFEDTLEVGYYAAVAGIVWGFSMLSNSLNAVMLPHLAKYDYERDRKSVEKLLWRTHKYLFMFILPFIAVFILLGPQICSMLFGGAFRPSGPMLAGMSGVVCFYAYVGLGAQVLYSTNKERVYSVTATVSMLVTLCLFFLLIPSELFGIKMLGLGGKGAAIALSLGYVIHAVMISVAVKKAISVAPYPGLWKHMASFIVSFALLYLFISNFDVDVFAFLVIGCFLFITAYALMMVLLKELGRNDFRFFKDAVSAKGLYASLSEEFGGDDER